MPISRDCFTVQPWVPFSVIYNLPIAIVNSPKCAASSELFPLAVGSHVAFSSWPCNPVVLFTLSLGCTIRICRSSCSACVSEGLVCMNNALLYCGKVNLYSYCNVNIYRFRENSTGLSCVQKAASCNKVDVFLRFYGLFYAGKSLDCIDYRFTDYRLNTE